MTGIILFQSKYGATEKYADWLSQETGFPCIETKKASVKQIIDYDVIILGGGVYASGIAGMSFLKKNISALSEKKIIIFCCGMAPFDDSTIIEIKNHNMKEMPSVPLFYCRGACNTEKMSFTDRALCNMLRKAVAKKNPEDYNVLEKALIEAENENCDWTDKKYLEPIIEYINKL